MQGKIKWGEVGNKYYETGIESGVLYPISSAGVYDEAVAWDGLISVNESPSGAEETKLYADDNKYGSLMSAEDFGGTIEAYQSPKEFDACDGTAEIADGVKIGQQDRKVFGMSYKTKIGNDVDGDAHAYKLHLVYGAKASPSEKSYSTINESPEAQTLSWEFTTTPVNVTGMKATSTVVIDSRYADEDNLTNLEEVLYGKDPVYDTDGETIITPGVQGRLPLPDEVATIMSAAS